MKENQKIYKEVFHEGERDCRAVRRTDSGY